MRRMRIWWKRMKAVPPATSPDLTPYVVFFFTPPQFEHKKLNVGKYTGFMYSESMGGGTENDGRLLTTWRNKPAYDAAESEFLRDTALTNNTLWKGTHLGTRKVEKSWWKRWTFSQALAVFSTTALMLGNAEKIRDAAGWIIGPPVIETSGPVTTIDVLLGEPFKFKVAAQKRARSGTALSNLSISRPARATGSSSTRFPPGRSQR